MRDAASKKTMASASISLCNGGKIINSTFSDDMGKFEISINPENLSNKTYIVCKMVGYDSLKVNISGNKTDFGDIFLSSSQEKIDEAIVTSSMSLQLLKNIPIPAFTISRKQIESISPSSLQDILAFSIPGVEFKEHGGITHIDIRGLGGGYMTFLIDGEELAGLKNGSMDFKRIDPENIEKIEVIRGAGSALYGSNAIAGVINIITKDSHRPSHLYGSIRYSSENMLETYIGGGFKKKKFKYDGNFSFGQEGGYKINNASKTASLDIMRNKIFRTSQNIKYLFSDNCFLKYGLKASRRIQHRNQFNNDIYDYITNDLSFNAGIGGKNCLTIKYNSDFSIRNRIYPLISRQSPEYKEKIHNNLKHVLRILDTHNFSDDNVLTSGIEINLETLKSSQINQFKDKKRILNYVGFAQHMLKINPFTDLMYGIRGDLNSSYGLHLSPKASIMLNFGNLRLRGGYAHAFKAPTMMELYYDWSHMGMFYIHGNPNLIPETANQFNFFSEYKFFKIEISAGISYNIFKNKIIMLEKSDGNQYHVNVPDISKMLQADLQFKWQINNFLKYSLSYSYTKSPSLYNIGGKLYDISQIRPHNILTSIDFYKGIGNWTFTGNFSARVDSGLNFYVAGYEDSKEKAIFKHYEGYSICRISGSVRYGNKYMINMGIDNLFNYMPSDLAYQTATLSPGRIFFIQLKFSL